MATRETISQSEYLQLVGLLTLAARHNERLSEIEEAACKLVGEQPGGHVTDAVYGAYDRTPEQLLALVGIDVRHGVPE